MESQLPEISVRRDGHWCLAEVQGVLSFGLGETEDEAVADFWCSAHTDYALLLKDKDDLSKRLRREMEALGRLLGQPVPPEEDA
uniref:Uncharacterized protein n=1 Tax=viral metagenome TaxID=1070528 RepID=A0A6M3JLD1_9ZZZZ